MADEPIGSAPAGEARTLSQDVAVAGRNAMKLGFSLMVTWSFAFVIRFWFLRVFKDPARYGELKFADAFAATFFSTVELGVGMYIVREISVRPKHASDFWGGVTLVRIGASLLVLAIMELILRASHHGLETQIAVVVYSAAQLTMISTNSVNAMLQAAAKVDRQVVANIVGKFLWAGCLGVVFIFCPLIPLVALSIFVSELVKLIISYREAQRVVGLKFRVDVAATRAVLAASLPFLIASMASNFGGGLTITTLDFLVRDKREVGWYSAAQEFASLMMIFSPFMASILTPLLARAKARSEEDLYELLRRSIEGLLVFVIPMTLVVSLGAEMWMAIAGKAPYAESVAALRVISFGIIFVYLGMMLSTLLIILGHGWSVSIISISAIPARPILVLLLARPCERMFGPGGAALGGGLTDIITNIAIVAAHFIPIGMRAVDRRLALVFGKSLGTAALVLVLDRTLFSRFGRARLIPDMAVYVGLVFALGAVKLNDVMRAIEMIRARRAARAA